MYKIMNMGPFLEDPVLELGVREYSRLMKIVPATASKRLQELADQNLLTQRKERNLVLYKANTESNPYLDLKIYYNIRRIKDSGLLDYLKKEFREPVIFLFGSFAKAENTKNSDLDLFIITNAKKTLNLAQYEKKLATIQLFVHTPKEVEQLKKKSPNLINNVLNGIRLRGLWEVF